MYGLKCAIEHDNNLPLHAYKIACHLSLVAHMHVHYEM